jgi:hypothetical protein
VYQPFIQDLVNSLVFEIKLCHDLERIDELFSKRQVLTKLYNLMHRCEENQASKDIFASLMNPIKPEEGCLNNSETLDKAIKESVKSILNNTYEVTTTLTDFCAEIKTYE